MVTSMCVLLFSCLGLQPRPSRHHLLRWKWHQRREAYIGTLLQLCFKGCPYYSKCYYALYCLQCFVSLLRK